MAFALSASARAVVELTDLSISVITPTVLLPRAIRVALHLAGLGHRRPARKV